MVGVNVTCCGTTVVNTVDPIGDAGLLKNLFTPSSLLPVLVIIGILGGFLLAWCLAGKVDSAVKRDRECVFDLLLS